MNRAGFVVLQFNDEGQLVVLGCHPTGARHDKFDLPKGFVHTDLQEPVFIAAVRELFEETSIILTLADLFDAKDIGIFQYPGSSYHHDTLHLFCYVPSVPIKLESLNCPSLIENSKHAKRNGKPEHDGFSFIPIVSDRWFSAIQSILSKVEPLLVKFVTNSV
jgi:8-oxo-dGTP pyrophosphatase MutT (NUDIX family)